MLREVRLVLAVLFMFLTVAVDFTSKLMSVTTDLVFMVLTGIVLYPILMKRDKKDS